jgi:hypothetical protein
MYFSYVGDPDDPKFYWDRPDDQPSKGGNLPRRLVPSTFGSLGVGVGYMQRMMKEGRYGARQLDWGAWGLKMTGTELRDLLADAENNAEVFTKLDPDKTYVLIVAESV